MNSNLASAMCAHSDAGLSHSFSANLKTETLSVFLKQSLAAFFPCQQENRVVGWGGEKRGGNAVWLDWE